jgi:uncharacterized protein
MTAAAQRFPGRAPIDAYGNGGFRFAGMSHRGSLLCLTEAIEAWAPLDPHGVGVDDLRAVLARLAPPDFLLVGTGPTQIFPAPPVRQMFADAGIALEVMSTGAACRTFNVLLAERRPVCAALVAVV